MDFGYSISPSSSINLDEVDLSLYKRVAAVEPDIRICMSCGSCSATCVGARHSGMSLRKVIHLMERGRLKDVRSMLDGCMLCGKCSMVCPRGINTRRLILTVCRYWDSAKPGLDRNADLEGAL